ncbi:hypothetical protein L211DRAFT_835767 [Terfezia boudieri ATCC MYA-4762]|uniref:Uncharacterized protein n=1 Tax=Terfezia boudieri ATCC MYA-4762 TaxID=1051890 RepID=A0A3N4M997_9PEZI|nr:hypothetical protein L211DRAFT_835767 [Terfezia boudieri ATCC MYA-4762]
MGDICQVSILSGLLVSPSYTDTLFAFIGWEPSHAARKPASTPITYGCCVGGVRSNTKHAIPHYEVSYPVPRRG